MWDLHYPCLYVVTMITMTLASSGLGNLEEKVTTDTDTTAAKVLQKILTGEANKGCDCDLCQIRDTDSHLCGLVFGYKKCCHEAFLGIQNGEYHRTKAEHRTSQFIRSVIRGFEPCNSCIAKFQKVASNEVWFKFSKSGQPDCGDSIAAKDLLLNLDIIHYPESRNGNCETLELQDISLSRLQWFDPKTLTILKMEAGSQIQPGDDIISISVDGNKYECDALKAHCAISDEDTFSVAARKLKQQFNNSMSATIMRRYWSIHQDIGPFGPSGHMFLLRASHLQEWTKDNWKHGSQFYANWALKQAKLVADIEAEIKKREDNSSKELAATLEEHMEAGMIINEYYTKEQAIEDIMAVIQSGIDDLKGDRDRAMLEYDIANRMGVVLPHLRDPKRWNLNYTQRLYEQLKQDFTDWKQEVIDHLFREDVDFAKIICRRR